MVSPSRDPSEKLAGEIRQLVDRWRLEWNISIHEIIGALDTEKVERRGSGWWSTEGPIEDDREGEEE